jgi:hypothetical protein
MRKARKKEKLFRRALAFISFLKTVYSSKPVIIAHMSNSS